MIATYRTEPGPLHVGVAFRPEEHQGRWVFLHQAFHLDTRAEEWTGGRGRGRPLRPGVWSELQLPEEELDVLVTTCEIVRERYTSSRNPRCGLPYAVRYDGSGFEPSGNLQLVSATGRGLTCATFVLALCECINLRLLNLSSWPADRVGDEEWHRSVCEALERVVRDQGNRPADVAHLAAVRRETPCARYRPEEVVAGAALLDARPVHFDAASPLGVEIADYLTTALT